MNTDHLLLGNVNPSGSVKELDGVAVSIFVWGVATGSLGRTGVVAADSTEPLTARFHESHLPVVAVEAVLAAASTAATGPPDGAGNC